MTLPDQLAFVSMGIGSWIIIGLSMLISFAASSMLRRKFREYSTVAIPYTGAQVAEMMLRQNGIHDVQVLHVPGELTDHYDPSNRTVNLSESVYQMNSVAAAAVAAHECGHAIQHQQAYAMLGFRSAMVPVLNISSSILNFASIASMFGAVFLQNTMFLWIVVICVGISTLFALVTLPVEFDASKRALKWLQSSGVSYSVQHDQAKDALFWAAMTYVVGALGSLAMLGYYIVQLMGAQRDDE